MLIRAAVFGDSDDVKELLGELLEAGGDVEVMRNVSC